MTNLHHLLHGEGCPKTYTRGTQQIDHIYGCPKVATNTINAGILPFKLGIDTEKAQPVDTWQATSLI